MEAPASSGWELADGNERRLAGNVIPDPVIYNDDTVLPRAMVIGLVLFPVAVGEPSPCHVHELAFSHLVCDAYEGVAFGHFTDGLVLLSVPGNSHSASEPSAQSLHFGKGHSFIVAHEELLPRLFAH